MKVLDVLAQIDSLMGGEVTVEGFLVERAPEYHFYLAPGEDSIDELAQSILIIPPFSSDELENRLPGILVGSRYGFADSAKITGQLIASHDEAFPAALTGLTDMTVMSRGKEKEVDVSLAP